MIAKRVRTCIAVLAIVLTFVLPGTSQIFKTPPVLYPSGGSMAQSVAVADVNKDGKLDAIVANSGGGSVGVLLGNGDGTFQTAVTYPVQFPGADAVAVGDLNHDGWPDLVVGSNDGVCGAPCLSVLLNNGDGTFQPAVGYSSVGFDVTSIVITDVNGDGNPDLVLTNYCGDNYCHESSVALLLGNGNGTFRPAVTYTLSTGSSGATSVVAADLNHDGLPDLLVADSTANGNGVVIVLLNHGDGKIPSQVIYQSGGTFATSVIVEDVNGDGNLDAVVTNHYGENVTSYGSVGVLLGHGDGTFGAPVPYDAGPCPASLATGDFNGDGTADLVVSSAPGECFANPSGETGVLLNNGDGTFQTPAITYSSGGRNAYSVAVADVNQDGKPDLVVADGCDGYGDKCLVGGVAVSLGLPAKTITTVTTSGSPSMFGQPVTFTATITAAYGPIPDGTIVSFYDNSNQIGTGTTTSGTATFTTSSLKTGTHTIKASYPSSAYFKKSSGTVRQAVN